VGIEVGTLTKSGAFIRFGEKMLGQGKEAVKIYLRENPKVSKEILEAIWKAYRAGLMKEKVVGKEETEE
jgi:recombination protein RecA